MTYHDKCILYFKLQEELKKNPRGADGQVTWESAKTYLGFKGWSSIPFEDPRTLYISDQVCCKIFQEIDDSELTVAGLLDSINKPKIVAWIISVTKPILLLFEGKINNNAEGRLPEDGASSGARIEFTYTVLDLCMVVIAQSNTEVPTKDDAAQLMVELKSAQQKHKSSGLSPKSIYGILCSTETWEFWSCDIHGTCRRTGTLPTTRRDVAISLKNLRYLFEITYHTFFEAYVVALEALITRRRLQVTPEQQVKLRKWQSSLDLATIAFNMAKAAKDKAGFDDAVKQLQESFDLLPEDHERVSYDYLKAFKMTMAK
ncbi:hypothetical protein PGT21_035766 [Puccinia graminis f. sp. tritici]|uniref:Uncharacterized protein n=1 Tax=Puccinia graminis f. sp. tritici TaxID=56615 RepID=A0A5B0M8S2_PUCGR|nr:hypothetical protein PGTUg99_028125 [Puccinia graminis f. sp. tritici]KAA1084822.1 hypothetical protein PGT21_035766 [Puccinia graminis f. sp. tritici]